MAKYRITDNKTGKSMIVSGDKPPSEEEVVKLFAQVESSSGPKDEYSDVRGKSKLMDMMIPLAKVQKSLSESETLPVGGAILGGILAGPPGAAGGAGLGKMGQQQLESGMHLPTQPEANDVIKSGLTGGLLDLLGGAIVRGSGSLLKGAASKMGEVFSPVIGNIEKRLLTQTLEPSAAQIEKGLLEDGTNKILNEAAERGLANKSASEIWQMTRGTLKEVGSSIDDYIKTKTNLPKVNTKLIADSMEKEIARLERLGAENPSFMKRAEQLKAMQRSLSDQGEISFEQAWMKVRDWTDEVANYYKSGKTTQDIKPYMARTYKTLADTGRNLLKEVSDEAGIPEWRGLMDEYSFWKSLEPFASKSVSKSQTAVSPSLRSVGQRGLMPGLINTLNAGADIAETAQKPMATGGKMLLKTILQSGGQSMLDK